MAPLIEVTGRYRLATRDATITFAWKDVRTITFTEGSHNTIDVVLADGGHIYIVDHGKPYYNQLRGQWGSWLSGE